MGGTTVSGTADLIYLACESATTCEADGTTAFSSGNPVVVTISSGTPGTASTVGSGASLDIGPISCTSTQC
ncbi:MAG TPA: hypothetical protein VFH56_06220, partial [Acidimicrobiales bacterium]|nr:hypothetical protein [Acidimicrobiales bacterium]